MSDTNPLTGQAFTVTPLAGNDLRAFAPRVLPAGWRERPLDSETLVFDSDTTRVLMSVAIEEDGKLWMHLSVSKRSGRIARWDELLDVRDIFAGSERLAVQVLPPISQHYDAGTGVEVMHLWLPLEHDPLPNFLRGRGGTL